MMNTARHYLLGRPLATKAIAHERLTNPQGLAIFASDALSSTAYATEEILLVLVSAGAATFFVSLPIAIIISFLILLVSFSYHQVIHAYPQGGGVYNVAKSNLGEMPALLGAASLLVDYVLTAAVSVAAGVAAITSAFPALFPNRVWIGTAVILFLMWMNLRGVRESGKTFSVPTYIFIAVFLAMIGYGVWRFVAGTFPVAVYESASLAPLSGAVGALLMIRAFASGCTAMTGIEAVSNGVQAFKAPEAENAAKTLTRMAFLLLTIFLGVTFLAYWGQVIPKHGETVVSQVARLLFGSGPLYFLVQGATALILLLAANTPFADFPRVASQLSRDGYFPRQFLNLGSRLVFANGIIFLSLAAIVLNWFFRGDVHALIPLYAVGVFLGFSLSQLGMIVHWVKDWKSPKGNIVINLIGFVATSVVFVIVLFSKFTHGAWILIPALVGLVTFMKAIKHHYSTTEHKLAIDDAPLPEVLPDKTMIIPVSRLNRATLHALQFAKSFKPAHIRAVHVAIDPQEGEELKSQWMHRVPDVPIEILHSEYRDLINPILEYLKRVDKEWTNDSLIVVLPQVVPDKWWHYFLHNQTTLRLSMAIDQDPDIPAQILEVPVKTTTKLRA
jgi:amino acid transporter